MNRSLEKSLELGLAFGDFRRYAQRGLQKCVLTIGITFGEML